MGYVVQFLVISLGNAFFKLNFSVICYVCFKLRRSIPSFGNECRTGLVRLVPSTGVSLCLSSACQDHWVELHMSIQLGKPQKITDNCHLPFLPKSWKQKITLDERKVILKEPIYHFHGYGRKSIYYQCNLDMLRCGHTSS